MAEEKQEQETQTPAEGQSPEKEYLEQLQRLQAEFINYRARADREKQQLFTVAKQQVLLKFLEVRDNFERADKLDKGMEMIYKQFLKIFDEENIKECTDAQRFDPTLHEAIATDDNIENNQIKVVQKGYTHDNKIIRPAKVIVGTKEANNNE